MAAKRRQLEREFQTIPMSRRARRAQAEKLFEKVDEGRGGQTRGWIMVAPETRDEKMELARVCGANVCFLEPNTLGYPVCASLRAATRATKCKPDERGVHAAYNRASQYHNTSVKRKAKLLLKQLEKET
jgi:hypothetical protein